VARRLQRALAYPARYADAVRTVRAARAVGPDAPFDELFAFARRIGITQHPEELRWLVTLLAADPPRTVLEIGLDEGGTLFVWSRAAAPEAHLISIDTRPVGPLGMVAPFPLARRGFARSEQRIDLLMPADSHDPATRARIDDMLAGRPVDFLFVDGDHSCEGVWADFELYSPLVRAGGLIAFHDVSQHTYPAVEGVARFWREFTAGHETDERVLGGEPGFGIGVFRVPG
jgi:cephalosporin hydroxylase